MRQARLRRAYSAETIAQRAGITRKTLGRVEQGDPAVSFGIYARVLQALGLDADIALVARDDEFGRRLQDLALKQPRRTPSKANRDSVVSSHGLHRVDVVLDVRKATQHWPEEAKTLGIPARQQQLMRPAFLDAQSRSR